LSRAVYINATSTYFPNAPVTNDNIENVLGLINGRASRSKNIVLASNLIRSRHYAIDPVTRRSTHTNAQLTAQAVRALLEQNPDLKLGEAQVLCCGTTVPDVLVPAHGQMVQGELKDFSGEVFSSAGVCCSSMSALKTAAMSIQSGNSDNAIVTGSEVASKFMRGEFFESECEKQLAQLQKNPIVAFDNDFLRWMLSDAAAALYLSSEAKPGKTNLRVNWIDGHSYANEETSCMFAGGYLADDGEVTGWQDLRLESDPDKLKFAMNFRQDIRQLRDKITLYTVEKPLLEIKKRRGLKPGDYSWFVPHYSSGFFREILFAALQAYDFAIPYERWFTKLPEIGNIGSASMFSFLDFLVKEKSLAAGEKILCYVPESARFAAYYFELEVV